MITQENLTSSNIFVDTIAPRMLIGAKNHVVLVNSTDPFIPGAVVVMEIIHSHECHRLW